MNTITVNFIPCTPAPQNGYNLKWRVAGSGDPYTDEGNFFSSPAVFNDGINPEGTCYEGILQSDCSESGESGTVLGNEIPWQTICEDSGSAYAIERTSACATVEGVGTSKDSVFQISGGVAGDVVKVRAFFQGTLIKPLDGVKTQAALSIFSSGGTYDLVVSPCYADESPHSFSLTADTVLTMISDTATVTTTAESFKNTSGLAFMYVAIIEVNGDPVYVYEPGCYTITDTEPGC